VFVDAYDGSKAPIVELVSYVAVSSGKHGIGRRGEGGAGAANADGKKLKIF
jgi:hypothetical protein